MPSARPITDHKLALLEQEETASGMSWFSKFVHRDSGTSHEGGDE